MITREIGHGLLEYLDSNSVLLRLEILMVVQLILMHSLEILIPKLKLILLSLILLLSGILLPDTSG